MNDPIINAKKGFIKSFEFLSLHHSYSETFTHFLDFALYMLNPFRSPEVTKEFSYLDEIYKEGRQAMEMASLFNNWTVIADDRGNGFCDGFGDLFMELVSHGRNGQFFTPQPICDMMAELTYGKDLKPGMSVCDPACGSGRTLMSMAKLERKLKFYAADNDLACCKMTVLNMIVNSMEGEVAWMDTLRMKHYRSWHISNVLVGSHYLPVYQVTGPGHTNFLQNKKVTESYTDHPSPEVIVPVMEKRKGQLTLF